MDALVDTGARVNVISPGLLDSFRGQGIDLTAQTPMLGSIEAQGVRIGTKIYQVQVGVLLRGRHLLWHGGFLSAHVPDTVLRDDGSNVSYRHVHGNGVPYVILGQDAIGRLRSRLSARYKPARKSAAIEGAREPPPRIKCNLTIVGERRAV